VTHLEYRTTVFEPFDFHAFTPMEMVALPSEVISLVASLASSGPASLKGPAVFMEPRENQVRMLDRIPAVWSFRGEVMKLTDDKGDDEGGYY